jgi:SAM-dependent methyltransferase
MSRIKGYPTVNYDAHARKVGRKDYWEQVRRTVAGRPVDEAQINAVIQAIQTGLDLGPADILLDIACGNGALSSRLFDSCAGLLGVDVSPYLVGVAQQDFARPPNYTFCLADVGEYLATERCPERFTKGFCYGSFFYFPEETARTSLRLLHDRFVNVGRVFLGNLPDKARVQNFFRDRTPSEEELRDPEAQVGIWRTPAEMEALVQTVGWRMRCAQMPPEFYSASYRYDVVLERRE